MAFVGGAISADDPAANQLIPNEISPCSLTAGPHAAAGVCASAAVYDILVEATKSEPDDAPEAVLERSKAASGCNTEQCVITASLVRKAIGSAAASAESKKVFKLAGPTDTSLLSNLDIDGILAQWATYFNDDNNRLFAYKFNMADYAATNGSLKTVHVRKDIYAAGFNTFACVINSDVSSGRGKHWMALFGDMRQVPFSIEFFNSSGRPPAAEFAQFMEDAAEQLRSVATVEVKNIVKLAHQKSRTECGVYSLYYIWARLNGIPAEYFNDHMISDVLCFEIRQHLFADGTTKKHFDFDKFAARATVIYERGLSDCERTEVRHAEATARKRLKQTGGSPIINAPRDRHSQTNRLQTNNLQTNSHLQSHEEIAAAQSAAKTHRKLSSLALHDVCNDQLPARKISRRYTLYWRERCDLLTALNFINWAKPKSPPYVVDDQLLSALAALGVECELLVGRPQRGRALIDLTAVSLADAQHRLQSVQPITAVLSIVIGDTSSLNGVAMFAPFECYNRQVVPVFFGGNESTKHVQNRLYKINLIERVYRTFETPGDCKCLDCAAEHLICAGRWGQDDITAALKLTRSMRQPPHNVFSTDIWNRLELLDRFYPRLVKAILS